MWHLETLILLVWLVTWQHPCCSGCGWAMDVDGNHGWWWQQGNGDGWVRVAVRWWWVGVIDSGGDGGWRREWHHNICCTANTVPFWLIWLSHVIGPVVLAKFSHLSSVTTPIANNFWWVQKMIKKAFKNISMGVDHMQHFFLLVYSRRTLIAQWEIYLRFKCQDIAK